MNRSTALLKEHWQDGFNVLIGLFLIASPWFFGYYGIVAAMWSSVIVGVVVTIAAGAALLKFHEWEEWTSMVMGAWLILAPWLFSYAVMPAAALSHVFIGALVLALSSWSIWHYRHTPHVMSH